MTRLNIERIALRLHGIPAEIAQAAMVGLDAEILRRLEIRGMNAAAFSGLSPSLRLPAIHSNEPVNAENLRTQLADSLVGLLSPTTMNSQTIDNQESL